MLKKEDKNSGKYIGVILEDINSKFDVIKEGHSVLSDQVKKLDEKVGKNHQEFVEFREEMSDFKSETKSNFQTVFDFMSDMDDFRDETKNNFEKVFSRFDNIEDRINEIEYKIENIKSELAEIKKTLVNKADLDKADDLKKRVKIIEMELLELRAA